MKLDFKNYPLILKVICIIVLLPILAAPIVFFATIFFFDKPNAQEEAFVLFCLVNSYPLVSVGTCLTSVWLYSKYKRGLIAASPFLFCLLLIIICIWVLYAWAGS